MSHEKIKSIKIDTKENKVFVISASSNVIPKTYRRWHATYFDKFFDLGLEEVKKEILIAFYTENFQGESSDYGKFFKINNKKLRRKIINDESELKAMLFNEYKAFLEDKNSKTKYIVKLANGNFILQMKRTWARVTDDIYFAQKLDLNKAKLACSKFSNSQPEIIKL
jgi:hypothetical protein